MKAKGKVVSGTLAAAVIAASLPFIAKWEGVSLTSYRDVVGVWTICYGETKGVGPGQRHTAEECLAMLQKEVASYYSGVAACMANPAVVPVGVQASLTELAYNVGVGAVCKSTMMRKVNAGDYRGACDELAKWVKAGGRTWKGLVNRRADSKRALCLQGL